MLDSCLSNLKTIQGLALAHNSDVLLKKSRTAHGNGGSNPWLVSLNHARHACERPRSGELEDWKKDRGGTSPSAGCPSFPPPVLTFVYVLL